MAWSNATVPFCCPSAVVFTCGLELSEPVRVQRALHEPLQTQCLAVASDEPGRLIEQLLASVPATGATHDVRAVDAGLGLIAAFDIAGIARDAAQPG